MKRLINFIKSNKVIIIIAIALVLLLVIMAPGVVEDMENHKMTPRMAFCGIAALVALGVVAVVKFDDGFYFDDDDIDDDE